EPLRNQGGGFVAPHRNEFTGQFDTTTPNFFLATGGTSPITEAQCLQLNRTRPGSCVEFRIKPFISALDVRERTWGIAGAWQVHPKFSVGATVRYQSFEEAAFTFRFEQPEDGFLPASISVQTTGTAEGSQVNVEPQTDITFTAGFKWAPSDKMSFGGVYKKGPSFHAPTFAAVPQTNFDYVPHVDTTFHMPDVAGLGMSVRPRPEL